MVKMKIIYAKNQDKGSVQVFVDDCDFNLLNRHNWFIDSVGYARTSLGGKPAFMHDLVFGTKENGKVIDHIDRNKLNNQQANLRNVSVWHNAINRGKMKPAERKFDSPYVGVFHKHKKTKSGNSVRYEAGMSIKGRYFYAGRFETEIEAAYQRDAFAYMVHGHLAVLNFPDKLEEYKKWTFDDRLLARYEKWK
jgi:hypothetical protein